MSEENKNAQSEQVEPSNQKPEQVEPKAPESEGQQHYKNDMLKFKSEAKSEREKSEALEKRISGMEESALKEKNNYKELWERSERLKEEAVKEKEETSDAFYGSLKDAAIKQFAVKHGIADESLEDLDLIPTDLVEIEKTDTGKVRVIGAEEFIEDLKIRKPRWFNDGKINVNTGNPTHMQSKDLSVGQLLDLQKKDPVKYKEAMNKRFNK